MCCADIHVAHGRQKVRQRHPSQAPKEASGNSSRSPEKWPFLKLISSIPILDSPSRRSQPASTSAHTRAMIEPTVRHAIRISFVTVDFEDWVANHATVSSKG